VPSFFVLYLKLRSSHLIPLINAIFLKKVGSGTHSDPKLGRRGGVVVSIPGKEVPACVLFLKELPERRFGAFRHKNTPGPNYILQLAQYHVNPLFVWKRQEEVSLIGKGI
jgi:hypothetical protein